MFSVDPKSSFFAAALFSDLPISIPRPASWLILSKPIAIPLLSYSSASEIRLQFGVSTFNCFPFMTMVPFS